MLMRNEGIFEVRQLPRNRRVERETCKRRVGLLFDRGTWLADGVLGGVGRYLKENGGWRSAVMPASVREGLPAWLKHWRPEGVLLMSEDAEILQTLQRGGVPVVMV